jgi:hypothetical protein
MLSLLPLLFPELAGNHFNVGDVAELDFYSLTKLPTTPNYSAFDRNPR